MNCWRKPGFDGFVEEQCRKFYAPKIGRPSLAPGIYFRLLLVGYFEGLDSERGIAWRAADSLGAAAVSADRTGGGADGSLDDLADAAADRRGNASRSVLVGAGSDREEGVAEREDAGDSTRRRWKPMRRCEALCGGRAGRATRSF